MSWQYNPFTSKLDYFQENILPDVPDVQVFFSTDLPTDEGVVFNPDTPALTNTLYISETTSQVYTYADGVYSTYTSPTPNNTPFYLYGTTVDAGGNKTGSITRNGAVAATSFNTKKNLTSTGATNHNKWWKVFDYNINANYIGDSFKLQMNEYNNSLGSGKSVIFNIIVKRQDPSVYLTVNVESGVSNFDLSNLEVLYNSTTKRIIFYYRVTTTYTFTNWLMLNMNGGVTFFNTLIGASLSGETSNAFTTKDIFLNRVNGAYTLPNVPPAEGQVLGYSASGISGWVTGISGAGTANRLVRWTASNVQGNSLLQDDGTSLSIGTAPVSNVLLKLSSSSVDANIQLFNSQDSGTAVYGTASGSNGIGASFIATGTSGVMAGLVGSATGVGGTNYGARFSASNGVNNYAIQLQDGTEAIGRVLTSYTANGEAHWADLNTSIPQAQIIYVDSLNGVNSATGRGDINKPYLTPEYALSNITNTGTITGNTATNYTISGISDANNVNLKVGQNIGGTGITYDTVIVAKGNQGGNANTITVSKATTATATGVTITWVTAYRLVLNGNFVATSNWYKQGMYIDAQTSTISWGAFFLFSNTTTQIMPYTLLGNGRYSQTTAASSRFFYFSAIQTSDFSINLNYETVHTIDTSPIFHISTGDGRCVLRGVLAKALFGSVALINTSKVTVYSSTYGLLGGYSSDNIAVLNLEGGVHQTPSSIYVIIGSISQINTNCTLYGSVNGSFWVHNGVLSGTTLTLSGGSITAVGSGTIHAGGNGCSINTTCGNLGNFDLVANGAYIENNGEVRGLNMQAGTCINNGHITTGFTISGGTFINNGVTDPLGGAWTTLVAGAKIYNNGLMKITILGQSGGTWENRGTLELYSYGQVTSIVGGTFKNYGTVKNISKDTDIFQLSGTGIIENYGTIENTNVNTTSAIIKKSGGTLKLFPGSILKVANGLSPIWCVNNDSASKDIYNFHCITNCNGTSYGLGYAFTGGYVPNDLVGGISYENTNY